MKNAKKLLLYLPYVVFALLGTKLGQAVRLAPGKGFSEKAMHILEGFKAAFASWLPSFAAVDTNGATLWLWSCLPTPGAPGP